MGEPYNLRRVARKLRLYHRLAPPVEGEVNVFSRVEYLAHVSKDRGCAFPYSVEWIMERMGDVERALQKDPGLPQPLAIATC